MTGYICTLLEIGLYEYLCEEYSHRERHDDGCHQRGHREPLWLMGGRWAPVKPRPQPLSW